ncbi:MAB_1171c family putative transporter [Streptomyces sp. NPDC057686]|uniref:MAB_1171c family putative transporter n=1 Tax=Streptomyces sp. NPDC057686 TaxID=3346212 RepID=UPI0036C417B0
MHDPDYYIPAGALFLALLSKAPNLLRRRRDPATRAMAGLLATACTGFAVAAPPTIRILNRATGIRNISAPVVYVVLAVFNACCIMLLMYWREGSGPAARRRARRWLAAGTLVACVISALFAAGDAPVERLRDFDTYYARTPFIREMITLYLAWHILVGVVLPVVCWRWSRQVNGWVRASLRTLVAGFLCNALFGLAKTAALVARWAGGDLDHLGSNVAPPVAALGAMLATVGFLLPRGELLTARWRTWRTYHRLGPLHRDLRAVAPARAKPRAPFFSLRTRLRNRECDLYDGLLALAPYCDPTTMAAARSAALRAGRPADAAFTLAAAAMIAAAVETRGAAVDSRDATAQSAGLKALGPVFFAGGEGLARVATQYARLVSLPVQMPSDAPLPRHGIRSGRAVNGGGDPSSSVDECARW